MTREEAARALKKLTGAKNVKLKVGDKLSSPEKRAAADEQFLRIKAEIENGDARVAEIIAANQEIQAIYARRRELRPLKERLAVERTYHKFKLLDDLDCGIGWNWRGQGDTWEEALGAAKASVERDIQRAETLKGGRHE